MRQYLSHARDQARQLPRRKGTCAFRRRAAALLAGLLLGAAGAASVSAHGGYPARLAVREDPDLVLLARLVLVYLTEGQGMTVHLTVLDSAADAGREYASGKIDLFVDAPPREWRGGRCAAGDEKAYLEETYPAGWSRPFFFTVGSSPCARPFLVAHPRMTTNLRFTLLQEVLERVVGALSPADLEKLRREGKAGPRDAAAAARKLLAGKGLI